MKEYLETNGYTKIIIQSSPYLRCLQTAKETCKILGIKEIQVNYMLSEWMKHTFFESNPIDTLLIRTRDKKYILDKYLEGIEFVDKTHGFDPESRPNSKEQKNFVFIRESFPETWSDSYERAKGV